MKNDIPNFNWSLAKLAKFLKATLRRTASDAWKIGEALSISREKYKGAKEWLDWLKKNVGISTATVYRYLDVADRFTLEECENKTINEVYAKIEEQRKVERAESEPPSQPQTSESPAPDSDDEPIPEATGHPESETGGSADPTVPSWAVPEEEEDNTKPIKPNDEPNPKAIDDFVEAVDRLTLINVGKLSEEQRRELLEWWDELSEWFQGLLAIAARAEVKNPDPSSVGQVLAA